METFGEDRIIGSGFPMEEAQEDDGQAEEGEAPGVASLRKYAKARRLRRGRTEKKREKARDMNPGGFFESTNYAVKGISFRLDLRDELRRMIAGSNPGVFVKVVSQGLQNTNPLYVDRVIYMVRDPRAVAKSQERLTVPGFNDQGGPVVDGVEQTIHSAQMFNRVSMGAAAWFLAFPVPVHFVEYDDLIAEPAATLERLRLFLLEGDFAKAVGVIDPELRRSIPEEDRTGEEWDLADALYAKLRAGDWQGLRDAARAHFDRKRKESFANAFYCFRMNAKMSRTECELCYSHPDTASNFCMSAETIRVDWRKEPCAYECLTQGKTVEESIAGTHWTGPPRPCKFRGDVSDGFAVARRPCLGARVDCLCPDNLADFVTASVCGKGRCKFYAVD